MTTKHDIRFLGALTTLCGLLTLPACATGDGMDEPFEGLGEVEMEEDLDDPEAEEDEDQDEPADDEPTDDEPTDDEPTDDEPADDEPTDDEPPVDDDPTDDEPPVDDDPPVDDEPPVDEPQIAENDGDFMANPAVLAQFRNTSPAEVSIDEPQFNEDAIDTKGLQYIGDVSVPGDQEDWIQFSIVPGQNDPTISLFLDCGVPDLSPQPLRAELLDEQGNVLETVICGGPEESVTLHDASSLDDYYVRIEMGDYGEHYDQYALEIDAFCFQGCDF